MNINEVNWEGVLELLPAYAYDDKSTFVCNRLITARMVKRFKRQLRRDKKRANGTKRKRIRQ